LLFLGGTSTETKSGDDGRGLDKASLIKTGGLAVALGAATWLLAPILLPARLPADFPKLPDIGKANPSLRGAVVDADRQARRRPESAEVVGRLGLIYHANLFLDEAARAYRIAARLAPRDSQWAYCQAFLEEERGNEQEQVRLLEETLRLKPDHVAASLKLADALFKRDRLADAAQNYEMAGRSSGGAASLQAAFGLARVAARRRDWNQVIQYSEPLTRVYPLLQPPYELLQEAYTATGQTNLREEARQGIAESKSKVVPPLDDPLNEQLITVCYSSTRLLKQAGVLSHLGYPDRALQVARRAAQAEPGDPDVRNFIARTLIAKDPGSPEAVDEALTQLAECLRLRPDDPAPLWMFAQDFFDVPETPAAIARIRALMRPYAGRSDAHFYLGLAADAQNETAEAVSQYQAALQNDPSNSAAYDKLGVALDKAGRVDEAIAHFRKAVALSPMNAAARFNLGTALLQSGKDVPGLRELEEVIRLKPDYAPAYFCVGFARLYSKKPDEAIGWFRKGMRYTSGDAEAHYGLASALSIRRKRSDAMSELREALRLRPDYPEAQELLRQLTH
jgi:tetratricopeptide (TPR) repeat protein